MGSRLQGGENLGLVGEGGEHQNAGVGQQFTHFANAHDAAHAGQPEIRQHQIRLKPAPEGFQRVLHGRKAAHTLVASPLLKHHRDRLAEIGVVFYQNQPDGLVLRKR